MSFWIYFFYLFVYFYLSPQPYFLHFTKEEEKSFYSALLYCVLSPKDRRHQLGDRECVLERHAPSDRCLNCVNTLLMLNYQKHWEKNTFTKFLSKTLKVPHDTDQMPDVNSVTLYIPLFVISIH